MVIVVHLLLMVSCTLLVRLTLQQAALSHITE